MKTANTLLPARSAALSAAGGLLLLVTISTALAADPVNHAPKAEIAATSEFNLNYRAKFVADGVVPELVSRHSPGQEWAVQGATHRNGAELTMKWEKPVKIAELVYYSRSAFAVEGWKDYEIYLDDQKAPIVKGTLKAGHGPQRIPLGKTIEAKRIRIKFTSSFGGTNPGASEIQVFNISPPKELLIGKFKSFPPYKHGQPLPAPPFETPGLAKTLYEGRLGFDKMLVVHRHVFSLSHVYTPHAESFVPGGGIYILTPNKDGGELKKIYDSTVGEVMDLALSYDGKEILFSWKESDGSPGHQSFRNQHQGPDRTEKTKYQIYRMTIDPLPKTGMPEPKQLTKGKHNNFNPCWLPDGKIAFLSDRKESFAYCWVTTSPLLHRMNGDGSNQHRISHGYLNDFTPSVLNDGRIIYSRWEYVDRPAIPIQSIWAMNPDGTGLSGFFGNRCIEPGTFMEARSIGKTHNVLCVLAGHNGSCRGALAIISTAYGANAQEGIQNITPEIPVLGVKDCRRGGNALVNAGPYENPFPIDEAYFLVSKMGTIQLRDYNVTELATVLKPKDGMGFFSPVPIRATTPPPIIPSSLPEKPKGPWATVFMQDVYNGLEPHIKRGEIKQICVVQELEKGHYTPLKTGPGHPAFGVQFPVISCGATYAPKKVWGYAKVESDGSAHFKVPTGIPVYFMAIDEKGRAVQRMRTFTHFQPGERQSCVGCHADRNYATPRMPSKRPIAALRKADQLPDPEWGRRNFDYSTIVQPVLDKNCVKCHNSRKQPKGIDLTGDKTDYFNVSYDILARKGAWSELQPHAYGHQTTDPLMVDSISPYTKWIPSINGTEESIAMIKPKTWGSPASKLADMILSGHPDKDGKPRVNLNDKERLRVMAWIDLNVPYYSDSKSSYTDRVGCRRILPPNLGKVLADVGKRRCASCHEGGKIPRKFYTRVTNVEENDFLFAPLAKAAGGTESCGKAIFKDKTDPDYQKILAEFAPITKMLKDKPRLDMPGAKIEECKTCE